jgi:hypothetical protein
MAVFGRASIIRLIRTIIKEKTEKLRQKKDGST